MSERNVKNIGVREEHYAILKRYAFKVVRDSSVLGEGPERDYRKRRHGYESVVQWKGGRPHVVCAVCKQSLDQFGQPNKRKDAIYCSPACRQCAYRQRRRELKQERENAA
jgi:hypothetical protein